MFKYAIAKGKTLDLFAFCGDNLQTDLLFPMTSIGCFFNFNLNFWVICNSDVVYTYSVSLEIFCQSNVLNKIF